MSNLPDLIASDYNSLILRFKSFENDILTNGKENISKESQVFLKHLITCNHYDTYGLKLYIDSLECCRQCSAKRKSPHKLSPPTPRGSYGTGFFMRPELRNEDPRTPNRRTSHPGRLRQGFGK